MIKIFKVNEDIDDMKVENQKKLIKIRFKAQFFFIIAITLKMTMLTCDPIVERLKTILNSYDYFIYDPIFKVF